MHRWPVEAPFLGAVSEIGIDIQRFGEYEDPVNNFALEENPDKFSDTVCDTQPHDDKGIISDSAGKACPKGGWITVMNVHERAIDSLRSGLDQPP